MHGIRFAFFLLAAVALWARQVTVTVVATTDLHGNLLPIDYYTGQPAQRGLAKVATLIEAVRRENPNALLIDCGDTIQGTPLEAVYQQYVTRGRLPLGLRFTGEPLRTDPMMLVMNRLGYRAMVLGNHEFNFGPGNLERARGDARFPWISANTLVAPGASVRPFEPYIVETRGGIKVAVVGLTTPEVPKWEPPEHYRGLRWESFRAALARVLPELQSRHRPDLVVLAVHDDVSRKFAQSLKGVHAVVFGHTHGQAAPHQVGDVLVVQPRNWGMSAARLDFVLEDRPGGRWRVVSKEARRLRVNEKVPADPEVVRLAQPYHELAERYLNTPVAESPAALNGRLGRVMDTPLVDAVHEVQRHYAQADVSFTAMFNPQVEVPKGPVTIRQIAALYIYDNELYALEGNGRMVKAALEVSARYFRRCPDAACTQGPLIKRGIPGFNFEMAEGVEYEIDLRRAEGDRIVNLRYRGRPLQPEQKLRLAVNSYRAGGSGGYTMFKGARVLWRSSREVRDLIIEYYMQRKKLPGQASGNWRIVPEGARKRLEQEALGGEEAGR
jgi:2',3'-cyclic-nucleotide 2'-phosphodiesterase/3'-nucleotidase